MIASLYERNHFCRFHSPTLLACIAIYLVLCVRSFLLKIRFRRLSLFWGCYYTCTTSSCNAMQCMGNTRETMRRANLRRCSNEKETHGDENCFGQRQESNPQRTREKILKSAWLSVSSKLPIHIGRSSLSGARRRTWGASPLYVAGSIPGNGKSSFHYNGRYWVLLESL